VRWSRQPTLDHPVLLVAFGGWSDAGEAATAAARFVGGQWEAEPFATFDPEPFFDFTATRPQVRFGDDGQREIVWPEVSLSAADGEAAGLPLVTLTGDEPQLRWQTFTDQVVGLARHLDVRLVVTLGALLADVPHARPVSVFGIGDDQTAERLGLLPSRYEGPTGITGVLQVACRRAGIASTSLWAAVPSYIPVAPSPKAALALVERTAELLEVELDTSELSQAAALYEHEVSQLVERDDETAAYVHQLEQSYDDDEPQLFSDGDSLVEEVERYLRNQD
jgi:proteasome assembly chaperone (PAC2) family protein